MGVHVCDHCGCRELPPIGELMGEHDRIMNLAWRIVEDPDAVNENGDPLKPELRRLLEMHATKEERALYPLLIESGDMEAGDRSVFEEEHRDLLALVDSDTFDAEGSNVLAAHIEAEENDLFPSTMFAFDDDAWALMDRVSSELLGEFGIEQMDYTVGAEREYDDLHEADLY